jgi:hypothetical protein
MDDSPKAFAPELSPAASKKWIGRLLVAVIVGTAIWNFVVSLTLNVVLPGLARIMEADAQSPLYLGKGDFNLPPLFAATLELCFALIAAILVNSWAQSTPKPVRRKAAKAAPIAVPSLFPPPASRSAQPTSLAPIPSPQPVTPEAVTPPPPDLPKPAPPPPAKSAPAVPSKPKKVYYNSVGDPIEEDE